MAVPHLIWDGPETARATLVLAHGAGQHMDSPFMESIAAGVAAEGIRVGRFKFPYMAKRRVTGRKSGPDRGPILCDTWRRLLRTLTARFWSSVANQWVAALPV